MPAYGTAPHVPAIYAPGDSYTVWSAESPATNAASQQVAIAESVTGSQNVSVEIQFSAAPGTFSVTIQTADTDVAGAYTTYSGASPIIAVNSGFYASYQLVDLRCNFIRLFMTDDPSNGVTVTAKITR